MPERDLTAELEHEQNLIAAANLGDPFALDEMRDREYDRVVLREIGDRTMRYRRRKRRPRREHVPSIMTSRAPLGGEAA